MEYALSRLPNNRNQKTTHNSNYTAEIISEINDTKELSKGIVTVNLKIINQDQRKDSRIMAKYKTSKYKSGYLNDGIIRHFILIKCEDRIVILLTFKKSELVSYVSLSPRNGYYGGNYPSTCVLSQH